jgi:hypothetical protein
MSRELLKKSLDCLNKAHCKIINDDDSWNENDSARLTFEIEAELDKPEPCTNSDSWNCKYCKITKTCKALADNKNFAPPDRKPMSVEEIIKLRIQKIGEKNPITLTEFKIIARAIEKHHGISNE